MNSLDLNNQEKTVKSKFNSSFGDNERYRWTTETVEDEESKLIWQRQDDGTPRTQVDAEKYCQDLELGGWDDWMLPQIGQLRSLIEEDLRPARINRNIFPVRYQNFATYWSETPAGVDAGQRWFIDFLTGKTHTASKTNYGFTLCIRSNDVGTQSSNMASVSSSVAAKNSLQRSLDQDTYQKISESTGKVIGCGFFHVGCEEKALTFPAYQPDFHLKGYRRVNLWGKDRPWTDTELQLQNGDQVYFYGTGEVTTCPHSSCSGRGPQNLNKGSLSYKISEGVSPGNLNRFTRIRYGSSGFKSSIQARSNGALYLSVRDWNTYPPPSNYYDDNSGVYILDIFVIDPDQEESFNRFRDALFKANPEDSNVKAYLGLR